MRQVPQIRKDFVDGVQHVPQELVQDACGRNAHIFDCEVNSNPEVFFFVLTQNGELCSVDASGALKSGILCTSCTWLTVCMMKGRE